MYTKDILCQYEKNKKVKKIVENEKVVIFQKIVFI